jgi:hypothetical protein
MKAVHGFAIGVLLAAMLVPAGTGRAQGSVQEKAAEPAPVPAAASNRFDGDWNVRMDCPADAGAQAFSVSLPASVLNGRLFGSSGAAGAPGVVQVEGTIAPDGAARLQARGRTASPALETGRPPPGTPFSYDVDAHFDAATLRGSGRRVQDRACEFVFTRR